MPTPSDAAPAVERRQRLVDQAMETLDELEELTPADQLVRLGEVQDVLSGVLSGTEISQLRIPGVA
ncbi:hypothetical protein [uncultured Tessaracoccus sp.]|uniref:hypothetical protein n=1 Tax=uncultured Tessaracoccus sp. TaxID=905023 RepID=UPI0026004134|nr:hypothetical protein [uncultured Tessaracoccus sp.]